MTFRSRKDIVVSSAASTAYHFFRHRQRIRIRRRCDEGHRLVSLALGNLVGYKDPAEQQSENSNMDDR